MRTKSNAQRLTITELEQIRQRAEAATEGNWHSTLDDPYYRTHVLGAFNGVVTVVADINGDANADFITKAHRDIPALLTEVETLITEKAAARRLLDELIGEMANAAEAGYALAPETVRIDLEKIRKELIDHGE